MNEYNTSHPSRQEIGRGRDALFASLLLTKLPSPVRPKCIAYRFCGATIPPDAKTPRVFNIDLVIKIRSTLCTRSISPPPKRCRTPPHDVPWYLYQLLLIRTRRGFGEFVSFYFPFRKGGGKGGEGVETRKDGLLGSIPIGLESFLYARVICGLQKVTIQNDMSIDKVLSERVEMHRF